MEFQHSQERIFAVAPDGALLAEITFPASGGIANINHTFVSDTLRGQGIAGQLMEAAVAQLRAQNQRAVATCPYAVRWFESHPEQADLLNVQNP